ncbi:MAG: glycosyltransferase family 2 protein [Bacteroidia bacterium]|nr:glycosyltransferase family 2 protein [Bacteroidia bacterium]
MNQVSVIILCWNSLSYLQKFLPSLKDNTSAEIADLVVVDNGSSDGTGEWLSAEYPDIILKVLDHNYGYAGGYKLAIDGIKSEYIVLLNSDVEVTPGWIEHLVYFMDQHPLAGAVAPKIRSVADRGFFEYAGAAGGWIDRYGYPFCRGRIFNSIEKDTGQYNEPSRIFWASGACMMLRTDAYLFSGGLDPLFFAHMEEIDLCWRLHSNGYEVWYTPDSVVFHVGGGALPNESPKKLYLNFRNNLLLLRKNLPSEMRARILIVRKILDGVAALQYLFKGKPAFFIAVLKAYRDFYRLWKKEYNNYSAPTHPAPVELDGWYNRSIVAAFFIARKRRLGELTHHK